MELQFLSGCLNGCFFTTWGDNYPCGLWVSTTWSEVLASVWIRGTGEYYSDMCVYISIKKRYTFYRVWSSAMSLRIGLGRLWFVNLFNFWFMPLLNGVNVSVLWITWFNKFLFLVSQFEYPVHLKVPLLDMLLPSSYQMPCLGGGAWSGYWGMERFDYCVFMWQS